MEHYFFRPSEQLDSYLYSVFLEYASTEELEQDILCLQTNWQLAKHFVNGCKEYNVWFVDGVAVTKQPTIVGKKMIRRYYDPTNPNNPLNGTIIQPNIEV
jgi:flagellar basal body rod protein FlgC